nr:alpha/beta hydrolase-fold protein [Planosporangium thailandense]
MLVALDPPATRSHFAHRPGSVYLPPAYFTSARTKLPVIVMLSGAPGSPMQWPTSGRAMATADAYAATHHGRAPILLFVDQNGSATGDTECVDGPRGKAETYLTTDVPAFVTRTLRVPQFPGRWGIAGFSAGGTCALDLALGHPDVFRHFVDLAGDQWPNLGNREHTRLALFGGSKAAMEDHDPVRLLRSRHYAGMTGWFAAGINDPDKLAVARKLAAAAAKGGLKVHQFTGIGGHNWQFASDAFARVLPGLSADAGLR